jgi:hypothetical protein
VRLLSLEVAGLRSVVELGVHSGQGGAGCPMSRYRKRRKKAKRPPPPARRCGGCSACCTVLRINHDDGRQWTAENERCPRQRTAEQGERLGGGCSIYADRPANCRGFKCAWLAEADEPTGRRFLADHERPDQLGVMLWISRARSIMQVHEVWPGAADAARVRVILDRIRAAGGTVAIVRSTGTRTLITPTIDGLPPIDIQPGGSP